MIFLGQKRIIFTAILALAVGAGAFWIFQKTNTETASTQTETLATLSKKVLEEAPDTDGDGLKDWEEQLWGTDPNNPDTDGDGTPDEEEIRLGRNPLVPGPDDVLVNAESDLQETFVSQENKNLTQKMTRELFSYYIQKRGAGGNSKAILEELSYIISNNETIGLIENSIFDIDIKKLKISSPEKTKEYVNALAKISSEGGSKIKENELDTLIKLLKQQNFADKINDLEQFNVNAKIYKEMVYELKKIGVPEKYSDPHLKYINALNNLSEINLKFVLFSADPLSGFGAVKQYLAEAENIKQSLLTIGVQMYSDRLVFEQSEPGFAFASLITSIRQ